MLFLADSREIGKPAIVCGCLQILKRIDFPMLGSRSVLTHYPMLTFGQSMAHPRH